MRKYIVKGYCYNADGLPVPTFVKLKARNKREAIRRAKPYFDTGIATIVDENEMYKPSLSFIINLD